MDILTFITFIILSYVVGVLTKRVDELERVNEEIIEKIRRFFGEEI